MKQIIFLSFLFWAINCDVTPMIISICPVKGGDTPIYEVYTSWIIYLHIYLFIYIYIYILD